MSSQVGHLAQMAASWQSYWSAPIRSEGSSLVVHWHYSAETQAHPDTMR